MIKGGNYEKSFYYLFSFAIVILTTFGIVGCSGAQDRDGEKESGGDIIGAYFMTDESYKKLGLTSSANKFWCAIANDQITLSTGETTVYSISSEGNAFKGTSGIGTIAFRFSGNTLVVDKDSLTMEFEKDSSYRLKEEPVILSAPQNVTVTCGGEGAGFVMFQWNYHSDYGIIGAAIEIKTPDSQEYVAFKKIERVYMNMFTVQLDSSDFETGENYVRFYHIGGPNITNDHSIIDRKNSDFAAYRVVVNDDGSVVVEK